MKRDYFMSKSIRIALLSSLLLTSIVLLCIGWSNQPNGNRIEADFISNVYSKMDSVNSYKLDGYNSGNDVNLAIYGYTIFRTNDTLKIGMNYKWYEELDEWGYVGWVIFKKS
jgi:hypothetical protein